jgi:hypothetical protein
MNSNIINEFINFYITSFNSKSNDFFKLWKDYSTINNNNNFYTKDTLQTFLLDLIKFQINIDIKYSYTIIGDRRSNILLTYIIYNSENIKYNVSQFIQLAYSNNKEYWIHSSIFNIV